MKKWAIGGIALVAVAGCSSGEAVSDKESVASEMQKAGVTSSPDGTSKSHSEKMKVNPEAAGNAASSAPTQEPQ
jgi:uncharacterized protein YcfL